MLTVIDHIDMLRSSKTSDSKTYLLFVSLFSYTEEFKF